MRSMKYDTSALVKSVNRRRAMGVLMVVAAAAMVIIAIVPSRSSSTAPPPTGTILNFTTMYGVDGPFIGRRNAIRGVIGDELPWEVGTVNGSLTTGGHLHLSVTGVVFANDPEVPPNIRGTNDEAQFRALVS